MEAKYTGIQDLNSRGMFRAVLRTKPPDNASMITARYVLAIQLGEDKKEDIRQDMRPVDAWTLRKKIYSMERRP